MVKSPISSPHSEGCNEIFNFTTKTMTNAQLQIKTNINILEWLAYGLEVIGQHPLKEKITPIENEHLWEHDERLHETMHVLSATTDNKKKKLKKRLKTLTDELKTMEGDEYNYNQLQHEITLLQTLLNK